MVSLKNKNQIKNQIRRADVLRGFKISCLDSTAKTNWEKVWRRNQERMGNADKESQTNQQARHGILSEDSSETNHQTGLLIILEWWFCGVCVCKHATNPNSCARRPEFSTATQTNSKGSDHFCWKMTPVLFILTYQETAPSRDDGRTKASGVFSSPETPDKLQLAQRLFTKHQGNDAPHCTICYL